MGSNLKYSDGIAASRTLIAMRANAAALQRRLPKGWELAPYEGDDLRGTAFRGANLLVPFHEVSRSERMTARFSAIADSGEIHLSLAYEQGGMVVWVTTDKPNLPLYAARDPSIERWYQEDQVVDVVRSEPMKINRVSMITLDVTGELEDVFDGDERVLGVVIQRPYMRQVYVP